MNEFLSHFMELVSDPAHLAFEVFTTLVMEVAILGFLWPLIRRSIRREHHRIDAEHGFTHDLADPDEPIPYTLTERGEMHG